jgi:heat shock protein 4
LSILLVKVARNNLETYVYDNRANLDTYGDWAKYMPEQERMAFVETLNETEGWIYGEGESASKDSYEEKLASLKVVGDPVLRRYRFHDLWPAKSEQLNQTLTQCFESAV